MSAPLKILVVCPGNTCRSPMATGILKKQLKELGATDIEVHSTSLYNKNQEAANPKAIKAMEKMDIDISNHRSSHIKSLIIREKNYTHIFTVGRAEAINIIYEKSGWTETHIINGNEGVLDPYGKSQEFYDETANLINLWFKANLAKILKFNE